MKNISKFSLLSLILAVTGLIIAIVGCGGGGNGSDAVLSPSTADISFEKQLEFQNMGSGYFTIRVPKPKDPNDVDSSDEENSSDEEFILKVVKEGETETDGDTVVGVPYDKVVELNLYKNKNHKDTNPEVPSNRDYYYFQSPFTEI